jgi:hypothetical protein
MFKRLINSCFPQQRYPTFRVTFGNESVKLILEEEYLKISNKRIPYEDILRFGYKKTYFYFYLNDNLYIILKTIKSRQISNIIYERCIHLLNQEILCSDNESHFETDSSLSETSSRDLDDRPPDYSSSEENNYAPTSHIDNPLYPRPIIEN